MHGFLSAGQGFKYSNPLKKLKVGDKVFAYMKSIGYVGFGENTNEAVMAKDFSVDGKPLLALPLTQLGIKQNSEDPTMCECVAGVKWLKTFPRERGCTFRGVFANQNIVCTRRDQATLTFLMREFGIVEKW